MAPSTWLALHTCDITVTPAEHQAERRWEYKDKSHSWFPIRESYSPQPRMALQTASCPRLPFPLPEGFISFSLLAWNAWDNSLPRGRGMANVTSGGPLLDKTVCLQLHQQVSPGRTMMRLGKSGWSALLALPQLPVPSLFPTLVYGCFSPPHSLRNLTDVPGAEQGRARCQVPWGPEEFPVRIVKAVWRP